MPQETKMRLIEAVEIIAPEKKGELYLKLLEVVEDYVNSRSTVRPRIHIGDSTCVSCEG